MAKAAGAAARSRPRSRPRLGLGLMLRLLLAWLSVLRLEAQRWRWWLVQRWLRLWLVEGDLVDPLAVALVGGVDISFVKGSETEACAALVVVSLHTLEVVYTDCERVEMDAPYIPGYLAFREVGFLLTLLRRLRANAPQLLPQAIMVDGNGILHPNRFGLACHLGVLSGLPTVGVGKSLHHVDGLSKDGVAALVAARCRAPGDAATLVGSSGRVWGAALRTTQGDAATPQDGGAFKPLYVSVGHGLSLASALGLVRRCCRHRIPEPVRQADLRSREWLRLRGVT